MFGRKRQHDGVARSDAAIRCSFCEKSQDHVRKLIAGPSVFICDECVGVCNDIIAEDERFPAKAKSKGEAEIERQAEPSDAPPHVPDIPLRGDAVRCSLCRMPTLLEDGVVIPNRGLLCPGCIGAIEASVAERRELQS